MGYSREVYDKAFEKLSNRKRAVSRAYEQRRQEIFTKLPEAAQIERELSATAIRVARAVLSQEGAEKRLEELKTENLLQQRRLRQILVEAGYSPDTLSYPVFCKKCEDTGFVGNKMCSCFEKLLKQAAIEQLGSVSALVDSSFDNFSLDYYSPVPMDSTGLIPREKMRDILGTCKNYAQTFHEKAASLLFLGNTGLGKTHLSLSIARVIIEKGYGVLYTQTQEILRRLEREQFRSGSGDELSPSDVLRECDLLILDDLGSEFQTQFTQAALYSIINTRLFTHKPTIINTNLTLAQIEERYTERVLSRLVGGYDTFKFIGKDIRQQKKFG